MIFKLIDECIKDDGKLTWIDARMRRISLPSNEEFKLKGDALAHNSHEISGSLQSEEVIRAF